MVRQRGREGSLLELHRELIALRRELGGEFELVDAAPDVLAFRRGAHTIALNLGDVSAPLPPERRGWKPLRGRLPAAGSRRARERFCTTRQKSERGLRALAPGV